MAPKLEQGAGRLVDREDVGGGLVRHAMEVPSALAETFHAPGQYVSLSLASKETYFALAGEPGVSGWEVLVRAGGDVADGLLELPLGGRVGLSKALGEGFPMGEAAGRRLFVVATGSGLAAVRSVLTARLREGLAASTEMLLGVRTRAEVPLATELDAMRREGMAVTVCCSRESIDGVGLASGYVQDVLVRRAVDRPSDFERAIFFAAGTTAMIERLRELARELHVTEADVRTNF